MSHTIIDVWANFIATGRPTVMAPKGTSRELWQKYNPETAPYMYFGPSSQHRRFATAKLKYHLETCTFWDRYRRSSAERMQNYVGFAMCDGSPPTHNITADEEEGAAAGRRMARRKRRLELELTQRPGPLHAVGLGHGIGGGVGKVAMGMAATRRVEN